MGGLSGTYERRRCLGEGNSLTVGFGHGTQNECGASRTAPNDT